MSMWFGAGHQPPQSHVSLTFLGFVDRGNVLNTDCGGRELHPVYQTWHDLLRWKGANPMYCCWRG